MFQKYSYMLTLFPFRKLSCIFTYNRYAFMTVYLSVYISELSHFHDKSVSRNISVDVCPCIRNPTCHFVWPIHNKPIARLDYRMR